MVNGRRKSARPLQKSKLLDILCCYRWLIYLLNKVYLCIVVVLIVIVIVGIVILVVEIVVYHFFPLGIQDTSQISPFDTVARQPLNLPPCLAAFSCFVQKGTLRSSSPFGSLRIPIQCLFLNGFIPFPQRMTDLPPCSHSNL